MLLVMQVSERIAGAMHTSHLGLVPPKLNEEQGQLLGLRPSPEFRGRRANEKRRGTTENI